ncbi:NAD(P)-dependent oxidoreductase [Chelatococcus sp. GCM10030263]|uniref:NAD(P)-dependent oxidoreductase n=1 Tax=Chelatococcus sp. GCM10030263 TaxID=3273387 RepID=UPI00361013C5
MGGTVGIVGLGIMGGAIARNLVERGWTVVGSDLDPGRRAELAAAGVEIADGAAAVARAAPVVLTSLPSPAAAAAVATEIASSGAEPRVVVETSTLALADKLKFREIVEGGGHEALDCPLSGTGAQAKMRDLVVLASGDPTAIAKLRPLFGDFARSTEDVGVFGNGSRMKFVANLLVAIHNVAAAEAMVLAMKAGLDPHEVVRVIGAGAGTSRMFEVRAPMMAENCYEPATMRVSTWQKDMAVIGAFARELGCETPLFSASGPVYDEALASGLADQDTAAVCRVIAAKSGLTR